MIAALLAMLLEASQHGNRVEFHVTMDGRSTIVVSVTLKDAWNDHVIARRIDFVVLESSRIPVGMFDAELTHMIEELKCAASGGRHA